MNRKGFTELVVIGIIAVVVVAGIVGYFIWQKSTAQQTPLPQEATSTPVSSGTLQVASTTSMAGLVVIPDQYSLFAVASSEVEYAASYGIQYMDGGIIASGAYAGYHRVIAGVPIDAPPGGNYPVVFATKDYQTFIANGDPSKSYSDNENDYSYLGVEFNTAKVSGFGAIPGDDPPQTISLGNFVLVQSDYYWGLMPTSSSQLTSLVPGLSFFAEPSYAALTEQAGNMPTVSTGTQYIYGNDDVLVKTLNGPLFDYYLVSREEFDNSSGTADTLSGILYQKNQISSTAPLYNLYGKITPACGGSSPTEEVLQGISQSDLIQIGTSNGVTLYTLKNPNHPLNQVEYDEKIGSFTGYGQTSISEYDPSPADASNDGYLNAPIPSYAEYVAQNPILIFQDPWGRWIVTGEFDYVTPGGCGKPVIYLYPPKPTAVSVSFSTPMRLTTDIPTYASGGWHVMAQPDGELTDLQPQFTDCAEINSMTPGSEYAQSACDNNDYPYLYWEGQASNPYPTPTGGWIIPQNQISTFLNSKLTMIGLTDKERSDMMSYWVPQLLEKNTPYYRISFFQTAQMNEFIPMDISPTPDTMIRVFLDWSPLATMPTVQPKPEVLQHINRQGFTVVEWGGLKQ